MIRRRHKLGIGILLGLAIARLAAASTGEMPDYDPVDLGRPAVRAFADHDDLPQSVVTSIAVDAKGLLWVGTQDGAAYHDGRRWTTVSVPDRLSGNFINALLASSNGSMWFGATSGLYRLADGAWTTFGVDSGLPHYHVTCLLESTDESGATTLFVGTQAGLAKVVNGAATVVGSSPELASARVRAIGETREEGRPVLWIGADEGLFRLDGDAVTRVEDAGLPVGRVPSLLGTSEDGRPVLWVGLADGLARLDRGGWTAVDTEAGLAGRQVSALAETVARDGSRILWAGTTEGLAAFRGGRWTALGEGDGLPDKWVTSLLAPREGGAARTLWAGTAGGLARVALGAWVAFDASSSGVAGGLPDDVVVSLLEATGPGGTPAMWFGTPSGLACLEGGEWTVYDAKGVLPGNWVSSLCEAPGPGGTRALWAGTDAGLAVLEGGRWRVFDRSSGLPNDIVNSLLATTSEVGEAELWVGTDGGGLARHAGGAWTAVDASSGLPHDVVGQLVETTGPDGTRTLWACTNGGLGRLENGRWTTYAVGSGMPANNVTSVLAVTPPGRAPQLWVAMSGGGAARFEPYSPEPNWAYFNDESTPALPNNVVYQVRADARGRVYLFTNKGISRFSPREPTSDDPSEYSVYTFTTEDGLPADECNIGAATVDSRGRIWAGTVKGAAVLDVGRELEDRSPKPLRFEGGTLIGSHAPVRDGAALEHHANGLSFEYALLSYVRGEETRYRSQLAGYEEAPTEWTPDGKREFTNLGPGSYTFRVWGRDHAGNVSGPAAVSFEIRPAPWRTWWAYLVFSGMLALAVYGAFRLRVRAVERRSHMLEAKVEERTAELDRRTVELAEAVEELERSREDLARANSELAARNADLVVQRLAELERLRLRIATDLHDDVGSSLTQISILSEVARHRAGGDAGLADPLDKIAEGARDLAAAVGDVVWAIDPQRDHSRDLTQRMRRFASDVLAARGVALRFDASRANADVPLDAEVRRQVYLVFKEAVNNMARHSGCASASVSLAIVGDALELRVADDGRGFDTSERSDGHGLQSMRRRAEALGGSLEVSSRPGHGTSLRLRLPLRRAAGASEG